MKLSPQKVEQCEGKWNKVFYRQYFSGEKATKWETGENEVDGLTTNGVLIMHPKGQFCPYEGCPDPKPGIWREISVGGNVFGLRESRSAAAQGPPVHSEVCQLFFILFVYFLSAVCF